MNLQMPRGTSLLLLTVAATMPASVIADKPQVVEQFARLQGVCWGDGYHACKSSGCRPLADLPPTNQTAPVSYHIPITPTAQRGETFYDRFDAINRIKSRSGRFGSSKYDRADCDEYGCDSMHVHDASIGTSVIEGSVLETTEPSVPIQTADPNVIVELPSFSGPPAKEFSPQSVDQSELSKPDSLASDKQPATPLRPKLPAKPTRPAAPEKLPAPAEAEPSDPVGEATFDLQPPLSVTGSAKMQFNQYASDQSRKPFRPQRESFPPADASGGSITINPLVAGEASKAGSAPSYAFTQPEAAQRVIEPAGKATNGKPIRLATPNSRPTRIGQATVAPNPQNGRPIVELADRSPESDANVVSQPGLVR